MVDTGAIVAFALAVGFPSRDRLEDKIMINIKIKAATFYDGPTGDGGWGWREAPYLLNGEHRRPDDSVNGYGVYIDGEWTGRVYTSQMAAENSLDPEKKVKIIGIDDFCD